MFLLDKTDPNLTVVYSASDLTAAATCEWALMRRLDGKLGRIPLFVDPPDAMLERTGRLGDAHELRVLEELRATRSVVEFERPAMSREALEQAASETAAAFAARQDVLFQATFFDGRFLGFADFIELNESGEYEVYDTKLARHEKVTALLQLAAYSDQLLRLGIPIGDDVHLILGDGRTSTHRVRDILPVYRKRRARLQRLIDERVAESTPTEWGDPRYSACGRCSACAEQVALHRDVLLVAGIKLTQRGRLATAGIHTIDDLAATTTPVVGIADSTLWSLRSQAKAQLRTGESSRPSYEVYNPTALGALPTPDAGDIFFDFEGDPLYSEDTNHTEWGLDYLFGLIEPDETFVPFWAHNYAQERQALVGFLAYVRERRQRHPNMHIYHYASYERTHLLSLAARHGVGEDEVDDLLRANVLVDLYPVVKKSLRVGSRSYSIKKLEPLYMGAEHRVGVDNAADSITEYADARELLEGRTEQEREQAQLKLDAIADYNRYDCVSTLRLRDWLLARAAEAGVDQAPTRDLELDVPVAREPSTVYLALAAHIEDVPPAERTADQTAIALASAAIDYHRREGKKFWQEHFDRLRNPVEEWADTRDVLIVNDVSIERDWSKVGRDRNESRVLAISGEAAPGSSFKVGGTPFLLYNESFVQGEYEASREPGTRYAHDRAKISDIVNDVIYVTEKLSSNSDSYDDVPMALSPGKPPNPGAQVEAIAAWGQRVLDALPSMLADAALDILRRQPPHRSATAEGAPAAEATVDNIVADLVSINRSYLAVQGPPGTGKTHIGSHVIADLVVNHGWRIGVVAQSHATVENMLAAVVEKAGLDPRRVGKKVRAGEESRETAWTTLSDKGGALGEFLDQPDGFVLGGTAWDFANATRIPPGSLDLLVVDEAGQYSLASTIAAATSAQRLLLLGDPQQLPQVSQGSHPEPVDVSALGWLSEGHDVLPPEFGYFLARSWRMHPAVCAPVSVLSYEGKLESRAEERLLESVAPGLHPQPVFHTLNATSSEEEAQRVVEIARSVLGRNWTVRGQTRAIGEADIIVVAPYNAQVELLRERLVEAGLAAVPVGTVDKFQGREAAVAIVSLAASSAAEVPRGLEFLLLKNRLNVAISRAQWAAYLVYSPALVEYLPTNAAAIAQLSDFIRLVEPD